MPCPGAKIDRKVAPYHTSQQVSMWVPNLEVCHLIEHALRDLKLIESSAKELGLSTLGMPEVISVYEVGVQQGLAKRDISAIAQVLR